MKKRKQAKGGRGWLRGRGGIVIINWMMGKD